MTTMIFGKEAERYYDNNIPVMPLKYHDKAPVLNSWNSLATQMPDELTQKMWIKSYPQNNIGLVLGEASGLCAIDIDTDDIKIKEAILSVLPPSDWCRIGAKGMMLLYRRNPSLVNKNIANVEGEMIVEIMCNSRQMVLPPSIHPSTMKPYVANKHLVDALPNLVQLPDDIEDRLRQALEGVVELRNKGSLSRTAYQSRGGRDNAMNQLAGKMASDVRIGEFTVKEAIDYILNWYEINVEKVAGDEVDVDKCINQMAGYIIKDVVQDGRILPLDWDKGLEEDEREALGFGVFDENNESWEFDRIIEYLKDKFEKTAENSVERREAISFIVNKLAKAPEPDAILESRVLKYIQKNSGDGVTAADYGREIKKMRRGVIQGENHYEIAEAAIEKYQERVGLLRYWQGQFWAWRGDHWSIEERERLSAFIAKEYGSLATAKKANDHDGIVKVMSRQLDQELTDKRPEGVNFSNGFVNEKLELIPHDPSHGCTYIMPYRYMPENAGNFPKFNQLLHGYWHEDSDYEDKVLALQEAMCATIFGIATKYQRGFLLYGTPGSGKSQLLDIISQLVPKSAKCNVKPDMFKEHAAISIIHEKLLNVVGELPENSYIRSDMFKSMIGGEEVQGKFLYKDYFNFNPRAAHWFGTNGLPKSKDTTDGFFRRWLIFHFKREIPNSEKILDFGKQIAAEEIEAITAWAMSAYPRLNAKVDYTIPISHDVEIEKMQANNSSVRNFLLNGKTIEYKKDGSCDIQDIYDQYHNFVIQDYGRPFSMKRFMMEIELMPRRIRRFDIEGDRYVGVTIKK